MASQQLQDAEKTNKPLSLPPASPHEADAFHQFDYHDVANALGEGSGHGIDLTAKETELVRARSGSPFMGYGQQGPDDLRHDEWFPMTDSFRTSVVQGLYIGIFAIFGGMIRIMTAQYFGEECANPGTVGWLASGSPLCITGSGGATEQGGIIFADLPANMLGSFVMGFFASCSTLKLATSGTMNIAWLKPTSSFQTMTILHKAITTGFCGSLTTFSGWNSSMVVLLFGTGANRSTHVFNAIFGYIIGIEVAIGCFMAGRSLARRIYRSVNPMLANETDAMKERQKEGVYLNPDLPDFERRYLPDLEMGKYPGERNYGQAMPSDNRLDYLTQWRESTKQARRVNHPLLPTLITIEKAILVDGMMTPVPLDAESIAHTHGWNVAALREWARSKQMDHPGRLPSISASSSSMSMAMTESRLFKIPYAAGAFALLIAILLVLLVTVSGNHVYAITDRTMVYAMLCAPPGAIMRWELSVFNTGSMESLKGWSWFPLGTFMANLIGSILSIAMIAVEYKVQPSDTSFWAFGTLRAIKVGFVGSLTTVSTFVAEIHGFMVSDSDHAYPYMLTTLGCCCAAASLVYGVLVSVISPEDGSDNDYYDDNPQ